MTGNSTYVRYRNFSVCTLLRQVIHIFHCRCFCLHPPFLNRIEYQHVGDDVMYPVCIDRVHVYVLYCTVLYCIELYKYCTYREENGFTASMGESTSLFRLLSTIKSITTSVQPHHPSATHFEIHANHTSTNDKTIATCFKDYQSDSHQLPERDGPRNDDPGDRLTEQENKSKPRHFSPCSDRINTLSASLTKLRFSSLSDGFGLHCIISQCRL